ncbi:uncharacterized protein LOC121165336 [Ochotona curzoniae]|uniref:uncharacterized protein LOC121165336 n=1 Tax=Ochotona curzoniae TaxID=130825 RepID=UPI001B34F1AE|nr:uncharacterized protein LOC121165336 [Ochotona curzoniae]
MSLCWIDSKDKGLQVLKGIHRSNSGESLSQDSTLRRVFPHNFRELLSDPPQETPGWDGPGRVRGECGRRAAPEELRPGSCSRAGRGSRGACVRWPGAGRYTAEQPGLIALRVGAGRYRGRKRLARTRILREVQKAVNTAQGLFQRWTELLQDPSTATREEIDWTTNELRNNLRSIEWDLEDLDETINIVEANPRKFNLDATELSIRKAFITSTRQVVRAYCAPRSMGTSCFMKKYDGAEAVAKQGKPPPAVLADLIDTSSSPSCPTSHPLPC